MQSNHSRASANNAALSRSGHPSSTSSSGSSTPPLKTGKTTTAYASESTLIGGVKGGAPLARRQSASFNHVRTSSLVSSSPFKTGGNTTSSTPAVKPRPQINPSQFQHGEAHRHSSSGEQPTSYLSQSRSRSDENKLFDNIRKPRESKGFQRLPQAEAVTKSPFVEANGLPPGSKHTITRSAEYPSHAADAVSSHRVSKSATLPALSGTSTASTEGAAGHPLLAPNHVLSARPLPGTPQRPTRPVSMFVQGSVPVSTSPTTRSSLASRRLLGPRSPEEGIGSRSFSDSPTRYERRKTVTWDERCDVVEFEQDDEESVPPESVSDSQEVRDSETESEVEEVPPAVPPKQEEREWFGPDREDGRSPSPILSGSINDAADDMESDRISADPISDDDMPTPQRETFDLPVEDPHNHHMDIGSISTATIPRRSGSESFLEGTSAFRDDSMSTQEDSFHRSLREEPVVETSRLAESRSPEKFPRISRDAIRKQVEQQRLSANFDDEHSQSRLSIGDERRLSQGGSGYNSPMRKFDHSPVPSPGPRPRAEQVFTSSNVNLEDVQSALDRLMLGVEKGFEPSIHSNITEQDYDETSSNGDDYAPRSYGQPPEEEHDDTPREDEYLEPSEGAQLHRQSTAMSGTSTESTDGPYTPDIHGMAQPELPSDAKDIDSMYEDSKPLPPPPEMEPSPVMHHTHLQDETSSAEGHQMTLAVPAGASVRRGSTIKRHEEAIKAKRREQRALEGRPSKRRSHSTGDLKTQFSPGSETLEIDNRDDIDLTDAFQHEVAKLEPVKKSYMMKQRRPTIYASDSRVGHSGMAGDVHKGRAWRAVRRPSDMTTATTGEGATPPGKVFVRVLGIRALEVPLPAQPTYFTCVLNNGIHFVETPASKLEKDESIIDQEFELIEHEKLEFTLTIKVRKDAHIAQILNPPARPAYLPPAVRVETPTKSKGVRSFFSSPSKKPSKQAAIREVEATPPPVHTADPFGRYLKKDLSIARALVSFREIMDRCDTKLFETSYPLVGQCAEGGQLATKTIGEIVLQIFRLPPLPGIPADDLPQSLEECQRGLRHVQWHKVVYHEGVLTQLGGDCTTWRRRNLQVMGANLIAFNDVTKRPITTMDLRKITLVEDDGRPGVPATVITPPADAVEGGLNPPKLRRQRSFNSLAGIEHSFRVIFDGNENDEVCFFADNAEEKARWMEIFGALVGRIPHNPLWAELVWQRQQTV
ncbi:SubName: Full=Related to budding protein {ECO:0000313/EMBL:CCA68506.1} [Serendipita indica DSM 11827]|nr:SubName: Full=Related to budding protein {ECO:0000313/EMBL:CCA68506.1} [Serendipita indica DSM 11827]